MKDWAWMELFSLDNEIKWLTILIEAYLTFFSLIFPKNMLKTQLNVLSHEEDY